MPPPRTLSCSARPSTASFSDPKRAGRRCRRKPSSFGIWKSTTTTRRRRCAERARDFAAGGQPKGTAATRAGGSGAPPARVGDLLDADHGPLLRREVERAVRSDEAVVDRLDPERHETVADP